MSSSKIQLDIIKQNIVPLGFNIINIEEKKDKIVKLTIHHEDSGEFTIGNTLYEPKIGTQKNKIIDIVHYCLKKIGWINEESVVGTITNDIYFDFLNKHRDLNIKYSFSKNGFRSNLKLIHYKSEEIIIKYLFRGEIKEANIGKYFKYHYPKIIFENLFTYSFNDSDMIKGYYLEEFNNFLQSKLKTKKYKTILNSFNDKHPSKHLAMLRECVENEDFEILKIAKERFIMEIDEIMWKETNKYE